MAQEHDEDYVYEDYFRHESSDPAELSAELRFFLDRLAAAGIDQFDVEYKPDQRYTEVRYGLTITQARLLGYDEAAIQLLIEEAG